VNVHVIIVGQIIGPAAAGSAGPIRPRICDDYANEFNIMFNAKKSKCMYGYMPSYKGKALEPRLRPTFYVGGHSAE